MALEKSVYTIILNKEKRFLLLSPSNHNVPWVLPGGHQEEGEDDKETLRRELSEEIGIKEFKLVDGFSRVNRYVNRKGNDRYIVVYLATIDDGTEIELSHEHDNYIWANLEDGLQKLDHENWRKIVRGAYEYLSISTH